jgi:hypothetical protein
MTSSGPQSKQPEAIKAIRIQTSAYGVSRALLYGTTRVSGNLIWYGDFVATAHTQDGGK